MKKEGRNEKERREGKKETLCYATSCVRLPNWLRLGRVTFSKAASTRSFFREHALCFLMVPHSRPPNQPRANSTWTTLRSSSVLAWAVARRQRPMVMAVRREKRVGAVVTMTTTMCLHLHQHRYGVREKPSHKIPNKQKQ